MIGLGILDANVILANGACVVSKHKEPECRCKPSSEPRLQAVESHEGPKVAANCL